MDLLILGSNMLGEAGSPAYRGTYREWPSYCEGLGDDHPVNQGFYWFCREGGEEGVVHDVERARQLVRLYRTVVPAQHFELIEVVQGEQPPTCGQSFLGFDLSCGFCYSLLSSGLELSRDDLPNDKSIKNIQPLLNLIEAYFRPTLNSNGLFQDYPTTRFCLECMMTLQRIRPGLWEDGAAAEFEIVSVYLCAT